MDAKKPKKRKQRKPAAAPSRLPQQASVDRGESADPEGFARMQRFLTRLAERAAATGSEKVRRWALDLRDKGEYTSGTVPCGSQADEAATDEASIVRPCIRPPSPPRSPPSPARPSPFGRSSPSGALSGRPDATARSRASENCRPTPTP